MHLDVPDGIAWQVLLVAAVAVAAPTLVGRLGLPGVVGLLLGGLLIGPNGLDLVGADTGDLVALGRIGLLHLVFLVGLRLDPSALRGRRGSTWGVGALCAGAPMVLGVALGIWYGWPWPVVLLVGAVLASQAPVDRHLPPDPVVRAAAGSAVLGTGLAMVVLVGAVGVRPGAGPLLEAVTQQALGLAVVAVGALLVLPRAVGWALRRIGPHRRARYALPVVGFLAATVLAESVGVVGVAGAFLAGVGLRGTAPPDSRLRERTEVIGAATFVPLFVVPMGFLLDPAVLLRPATLGLAALLVLAALGGRALTAAAAGALGWTGPQAGLLFGLTVPQAGTALALLAVGLQQGLVGPVLAHAVLVLVAVGAVVAAPVVRLAAARLSRPDGPGPLGARVLVAVPRGCRPDRAHALLELAVLVARADHGTAGAVLVRREAEAPDDAQLAALAAVAVRAGAEGGVTAVVDRSFALGALHAAAAGRAGLLLVPDGLETPEGWAAAATAVPDVSTALVRGRGRVRDAVLLDDSGLPEPGRALAAALVRRLATGPVRSVRDPDRRSAVLAAPVCGEVAVLPLAGWAPPPGVVADPATSLLVLVPVPTGPAAATDDLVAALRRLRKRSNRTTA